MKIYLFTDGLKTVLICNVIGAMTGPFQLNPVLWGTDVLSIQADGSIQHRPQGTNGAFETFVATANFCYITPVQPPTATSVNYGFKFDPAS